MKRFFVALIFPILIVPQYAMSASTQGPINPAAAHINNNHNINNTQHHEKLNTEAYYQDLIDEYKKHVQTVPRDIRNEIKEFRLSIAKLQKEKREIYKKLSLQAQEYLKQEEKFRRRLPIEHLDKLSTVGVREKIEAKQTNK